SPLATPPWAGAAATPPPWPARASPEALPFLDARQLLQRREPEALEELLGGAVLHRAPRDLGPTRHLDELVVQQRAQHRPGLHAADRFDLAAHHRLPVGDH